MGGRRFRRLGRVVGALVLSASAAALPSAVATPPAVPTSALGHLTRIIEASPAPAYRRFGSAGMAEVAEYAASVLGGAGFQVIEHDVASTVYGVDYEVGHTPLLERLSDHEVFASEGAFLIESPTGANGITCTVRLVADVTPGDCGFVPFAKVSPEWKNIEAGTADAVAEIVARGGIGAVLQGDEARDALVAVKVRAPLAAVVAVVAEADVVGQQVRLRSMGARRPATLHNVYAVRRPTDPAKGYVVLQGHMDGWFQAAADNGSGVAAVLGAAERLAPIALGRGLIVALYDGEEWGLLGSGAFAEALASEAGFDVGDCGPTLRYNDLAAVVNLDASTARPSDVEGTVEGLLGLDEHLFSWRAMVFSEEAVLPPVFLAVMASHAVLGAPVSVEVANPINGGIDRTDGRWFHNAGVPVVWPVAGYPEYHTSADTLDAVDPVDLAAVTDATVDLIETIDPLSIGRVSPLADPGTITTLGVCAQPTATTADTTATTGGASLPATGRSSTPALALAVVAVGLWLSVRTTITRRG